MKKDEFKDELALAARELRTPAGEAPEFSTHKGIAENHGAFIQAAHETMKHWHNKAVRELLVLDGFARAEAKSPIGHGVGDWVMYSRALWRRINDSLIWIMCGMERHRVKRLCFYKKRDYIDQSNPVSALAALERFNADPLTMAVWNDATSCVDVGDVTIGQPSVRQGLVFLELKEGKVNEAILQVLDAPSGKKESAISAFHEKYGKKGADQLDRVLRQMERTEQAMTLLNKERGVDPVSGKQMTVQELKSEPAFYFDEREALLSEALDFKREVMTCVDGCLWLYANNAPGVDYVRARRAFINRLKEHEPRLSYAIRSNDLGRTVALYEGLFRPTSVPLFLQPINPGVLGEVLYGALMRRVHLFFDWTAFAKVLEEHGGVLGWAGKKERARRLSLPFAERSFAVFGEVPRIRFGGTVVFPSGVAMDQVLFDALRPRSLAAQYVESARLLESGSKGPDVQN